MIVQSIQRQVYRRSGERILLLLGEGRDEGERHNRSSSVSNAELNDSTVLLFDHFLGQRNAPADLNTNSNFRLSGRLPKVSFRDL